MTDSAEIVDAVELAAQALRARQYGVVRASSWLEHSASGFTLVPNLIGAHAQPNGIQMTVTTITVRHPLLIPDGVFEYQHAMGRSVLEAVSQGFDQWVQTDFVPLLDSLEWKPKVCVSRDRRLPATPDFRARKRRVIFGPILRISTAKLEDLNDRTKPASSGKKKHPPGCTCCLFTKCGKLFKPFLDASEFVALRLYAARNSEGRYLADCRVNGKDFAAGALALRKYASDWPGQGFEFRKQYVLILNVEEPDKRTR